MFAARLGACVTQAEVHAEQVVTPAKAEVHAVAYNGFQLSLE
jgi:hypothetical protein